MPPSENETTVKPCARVLAALYWSIALVDAGLGAVLDGVGADHRGADDRLGDRGQHHADLAADDAVGVGQLALEVAQRQEQRREADPHDERELPAVEQHHHRRDQHLADADDEEEAAEDQELADLVDVAGHPGDQRAAALGVLGEQRQVVDVPERLDPQRGQAALGGGEQPRGHEVGRAAGHRDRDGGEHAHQRREGDVGAAGAVEAAVEGLLDGDRDDDLADRGDHRQQQRAPSPSLSSGLTSMPRRIVSSAAMSSPVSMAVPTPSCSSTASTSSTVRALIGGPPCARGGRRARRR